MLQLGDEKMAKSEGNIRGLGDVLDEVGRDTLLMYFVAGHYRQPIAYSRERLDAAAAAVERVREAGRRVVEGDSPEDLAPLRDAFFDALADDFNTARALASLFDWIREANRREGPVGDAHLREMLAVLGLDNLLDAAAGPAAGAGGAGRAARAGAGGARLRRGGPAARRAARGGLGGHGTAPGRARSSVPVGRDRLRRQPGPRGAARPAGGAADLGGQGGLERRAGDARHARGDRRALRLGRPPGRLRGGRGLPLRRRRRAARAPRAVPGRARRGHRPAEPRRGLPHGGGRRRDGGDPAPSAAPPR